MVHLGLIAKRKRVKDKRNKKAKETLFDILFTRPVF